MLVSAIRHLEPDISNCRNITPILVIDDQGFPHLDSLKRLGFKISWKADIESIDEVDSYKIIASDIQGVGTKLGSDGSFIIEQVKSRDPQKYVIAFSAGTYDMAHQAAFAAADARVLKSSDIQTWVYEIENGIRAIWSPKEVWDRAALRLTKLGLPLSKIAKLEHKFVEHLRAKKPINEVDIRALFSTDMGDISWADIYSRISSLISFTANVSTLIGSSKG